ncbi:unnamed protein product [Paramecium sonneborni]|uniref:Uncharacterized protein n=1 Tax=Paramecium sonneborni TaxID=65129 RepID=A0A8S1KB47_9CILI|nr:unnamed protein product [Paramecium sonneborni]
MILNSQNILDLIKTDIIILDDPKLLFKMKPKIPLLVQKFKTFNFNYNKLKTLVKNISRKQNQNVNKLLIDTNRLQTQDEMKNFDIDILISEKQIPELRNCSDNLFISNYIQKSESIQDQQQSDLKQIDTKFSNYFGIKKSARYIFDTSFMKYQNNILFGSSKDISNHNISYNSQVGLQKSKSQFMKPVTNQMPQKKQNDLSSDKFLGESLNEQDFIDILYSKDDRIYNEILLMMLLTNNVVSVFNEKLNKLEFIFENRYDESILQFCEILDYSLICSNEQEINRQEYITRKIIKKVISIANNSKVFEVLTFLELTENRKNILSVLVRDPESFLLEEGALLYTRIETNNQQENKQNENLQDMSWEGLKTFLYSKRQLKQSQTNDILKKLLAISETYGNRSQEIEKLFIELESKSDPIFAIGISTTKQKLLQNSSQELIDDQFKQERIYSTLQNYNIKLCIIIPDSLDDLKLIQWNHQELKGKCQQVIIQRIWLNLNMMTLTLNMQKMFIFNQKILQYQLFFQNQEKVESELFQMYQNAIDLLETDKIQEGIDILKKLMNHPSIINQEEKKILYGIYISLAEILAQSNNVTEKCEALNYYYESTLIVENCWQTYRKMSLLFRQLGMMPQALNLNLKALQYCTSCSLIQPLLYQACCISFLLNNWEYFNKHFKAMKDDTNLKQSIQELQNYRMHNQKTTFVNALLQEQNQIEPKLSLLPQNQIYQFLQEQKHEQEIFLDTYNVKKFFKDIKNLFQINLNLKKNPFKENFLVSSTRIIVSTISNKQKKQQVSKELPSQTFKQFEKQKSKQSYIQQQFNLDQIISNTNIKLIEIIKQNYGLDFFSLSIINNNSSKILNEQNENSECIVAKFLAEQLNNQSFLTVVELLKKLIQLTLKDFVDSQKEQIENYKQVSKGLINCVVWAQYCTNKLVDDPFLNLQLLEIAFDELKYRFNEKKPKSADEQNKIKNYLRFINNMKLELLQTDIRSILSDKDEIKVYLQKYSNIMANIHSDIHFFQAKLAKHFASQLKNSKLKDLIYEKIEANQIQSELKTLKQVLQILTLWEEREQQLEDNQKVRTQFKQVVEYIQQNMNNNILKRLSIIFLNQFYFANQLQDLKIIYKFVSPFILEIFKLQITDLQIGFILLKFILIYSYIEIDPSQILAKFTEIFLNSAKGITKYQILLEVLKINHLKLNEYFCFINIDILLKEFIEILTTSKQKYNQLVEYLRTNIESDLEINYYLLHLLELKIQHTAQFIVQPNQLKIEINKFESRLPQPDSFSDASEDELEEPCNYSNKYKNLCLVDNQIESSFKITKKLFQFSNKTVEFLINHSVQINIGDPKIINHIKRFAKECIKCEFGMSTNELSNQLYQVVIQKYYFQPELQNEITEVELEFFGLVLPHCIKSVSDFKQIKEKLFFNKIISSLNKQIEQEILEFVEDLEVYIFDTNQDSTKSFSINEHYKKIISLKIESTHKSNLFYLLQRNEQIHDELSELEFRNFFFALAYKNSISLWNEFYIALFEQASNYLTQKQKSEINWFNCQKRVQQIIKNFPELDFLEEHFIILDLLHLQQQQQIYQNTNSEIHFEQIQQEYKQLFNKRQMIPSKVFELKHNFRILQLQEKRIMRKLYCVTIEDIEQNLENIQTLKSLIKQMNYHKIEYFLKSREGQEEMEQDILISIYKFIKRFLRHQLYIQLNQLIKVIKKKLPNLLNQAQVQFQFQFEHDKKNFKVKHFQQDQLEQENNETYCIQDVNLILNNILDELNKNKNRFIKKQPQRYLIESFYYSTHLLFHSDASIDQVFNSIQTIYLPNTKDLVYYYKYIDRYAFEKDDLFSNYYFHEVNFIYQRSKFLKLILKILLKQKKYKEILSILDKLNKSYDLKLTQASFGLLTQIKNIDDKILIRDIIMKIESLSKFIDFFKEEQIQQQLAQMYLRLYEKEQQEQCLIDFEDETDQIKVEKGKKIIEDFKAARKKPTKLKENLQISQQQFQTQQSQIQNQQLSYQSEYQNDEIGQSKTQEGSHSPLIDLDVV